MKIGDRCFVNGYIDEIRKDIVIVRNKGGYFGTDPGEVKVDEQPTIEPEPHWIPCSERLPEEGQHCLVCDYGIIMIDTFIGHGNPHNWKWHVKDYEAWMPLPEPYQAERRGRMEEE